jgi:DNA-binding response OmpR family regulator
LRILVVDDESRISNLLKIYLEREDFQVTTEEDGLTGLERAINEHFDLVVLDVLMPGKNGYQVLEELRKVKDIPAILLSAQYTEEDQKRGIALGANAFIAKPFSPKTIVSKIRELLLGE